MQEKYSLKLIKSCDWIIINCDPLNPNCDCIVTQNRYIYLVLCRDIRIEVNVSGRKYMEQTKMGAINLKNKNTFPCL
jgi:hypothetical protein